jgi:ADP-ribose pyrophosphatase YjhB (NUDIX family)
MENRYAAAAIIYNGEGKVLIARRAPTKFPYPNSWSLPSTYMRDSGGSMVLEPPLEEKVREQLTSTILKKLGVRVILEEVVGTMDGEQADYHLTMTDFAGRIVGGEIRANQIDFSEAGFYDPVEKLGLHPKGFCSQILMKRIREDPDFLRRQ